MNPDEARPPLPPTFTEDSLQQSSRCDEAELSAALNVPPSCASAVTLNQQEHFDFGASTGDEDSLERRLPHTYNGDENGVGLIPHTDELETTKGTTLQPLPVVGAGSESDSMSVMDESLTDGGASTGTNATVATSVASIDTSLIEASLRQELMDTDPAEGEVLLPPEAIKNEQTVDFQPYDIEESRVDMPPVLLELTDEDILRAFKPSESPALEQANSEEREPEEREPEGREPEGREPEGREPEGREPEGREPEGRESEGRQPEGREPEERESEGREPEKREPEEREPPKASPKEESPILPVKMEFGDRTPDLGPFATLLDLAEDASLAQLKQALPTGQRPVNLQVTAAERELDAKHRQSADSFLQHVPCFKIPQFGGHDEASVPKCRECHQASSSRLGDVYCRFLEFRRLQYEGGKLRVAGFPNPYKDPLPEDVNIWQPDENTPPTAGELDIQTCRYILLHAGDQFCYLWRQEFEALKMHENPNDVIAWKKLVRGVREICDVCDTTLFNIHWTCEKCGFSVCAECVRDRKENRRCRKFRDTSPERGRDEAHWLRCTDSEVHRFEKLMLTQIIAGHALNHLGEMMHAIRSLWKVPQMCGCRLSKRKIAEDTELERYFEGLIKQTRIEEHCKPLIEMEQERLRRLQRERGPEAGPPPAKEILTINDTPFKLQDVIKLTAEDPISSALKDFQHINFLRKGLAGLRRFLPPLSNTLTFSNLKAPSVPHEWLCEGRLLRLLDPLQPENRVLFQDVWKCGQPVVISDVSRSLDLSLWHPQAFCADFGDKPNDLINCLNGNLVPQQPMRHFWEGFQCIKKRLLDAKGQPMLLKLKDWPPGDDFAEIMPSRYLDLMRGLPMPEYTLRTGHLNIACCLPKMFVPPDLGPKMYNAYGSALHPDKGTTNLHLDISDAVNIMVYVGIPADEDSEPLLAATQKAIATGGCDYLTRSRVARPDAVPGALWHIFSARDADKIRNMLNCIILEKGYRLEPDHDVIHDQNWYLDDKLRARLFAEHGVESYAIVQCLGDAVFIPAGAPHQVQNLHNCIKVAEDFVSPENITHCYHLTHEFRRLSHSHTNHEDKLQIKNIIYHAIKDCCTILQRKFDTRVSEEIKELQREINEQGVAQEPASNPAGESSAKESAGSSDESPEESDVVSSSTVKSPLLKRMKMQK